MGYHIFLTMVLRARAPSARAELRYKTINKSTPLIIYIIGLSMLKINIKLTQDLLQVETCLYLSYLLRQDKGLSCTGE